MIFLNNIAFASYDNNFKIRIGIYFGSKAKSSYSITGQNLSINVNGRSIWNTGSDRVDVAKAGSIYIGERYDSFESASIYSNTVYYSNGFYYTASENGFGELNSDANIKISANGNSIVLLGDKNQYISSSDNIVGINGALYRDFASIYNDGQKIIAINEVGMDNYLKGVIAKEMPSTAHIEALKAQAIASRNFAISNINKYIKNGYNLDNTTASQVYGGLSAETPNTNLAVELTSGELMYYGNEVVAGYFHASSGGKTESSENIWNITKPYLIGVNDHYSLGNSYDNWTVMMSAVEMRLQLQKNAIDVGEILSITPQYSSNGRIVELTINGAKSLYTLKKDRIRTVLGSNKIRSTYFTISSLNGNYIPYSLQENQFSQSNNLNSLYKNLALIIDSQKMSYSNSVSGTNFVINGKGYGHGVGMSQYGAMQMAKEGYKYDEILKHYFRGVEIR